MNYNGKKAENLKLAYIGGGSRGWAWGLMSDLASAEDLSGSVYLYDIDLEAAKNNEIIGNKFNSAEGAKSKWSYKAVETIDEALTGADFVIISILPGTFDEMHSDVHTPEKYGIYQSVGDTSGPGGIVRAMRTVPMYEYIGEKIKECCPSAWVISYTNPMTLCIKTLYRVFPEIRAFGCCHEVFGTQSFLAAIAEEALGVECIKRSEIKVNPVSVNHFTSNSIGVFLSGSFLSVDSFFSGSTVFSGLLRTISACGAVSFIVSFRGVSFEGTTTSLGVSSEMGSLIKRICNFSSVGKSIRITICFLAAGTATSLCLSPDVFSTCAVCL